MIIEPVPPPSLLAVLATLDPIDETFPDIRDPAPEPVDLQRLAAMPSPRVCPAPIHGNRISPIGHVTFLHAAYYRHLSQFRPE